MWVVCGPQRRRARPRALALTCPAAARAEIGKAFVTHYYATFDGANRASLQTLYKDGSMLTFENEQFMGMQAIMTKLTVRARPSTAAPRLYQRPRLRCCRR